MLLLKRWAAARKSLYRSHFELAWNVTTKRDVCLLLSCLVLELSFAISLKSRLEVFYILCTSFNITFSLNGEPNASEITIIRNTSLSCMLKSSSETKDKKS